MPAPSSRLKLIIGIVAGIAIGATFVATLQPGSDGSASRETLPEPREAPGDAPGKKKKSRAPGQPEPYYGELASLAAVNIRDAVLDVVAKGLKYPWAMEFISDTELLITEFSGNLQRVNIETGTRYQVTGLPEITHGKGQLGLMDLALHPDFSENGLVYFSHAVSSPDHDDRYATGLTRARLDGNTLREVKLLLIAEPYTKSASNLGGALEFDAAGFLYLAIGDRSINYRAQETDSLHGKILRLTADGGTPTDNPFVDDPAVDDRIYALGVRNTQGLVFDSVTNMMFQSEHGPMGGDEVNIIEGGKNYGWPVITYGANYTTAKIGLGTAHEGMEQPLYYYLPSIAASPLTIYRGNMFPEWEGHLLVGALRGAHVSKLALVEGQIRSEQGILQEAKGRIRDLKTGPDGSLYILVQNGGRLLRLYRAPEQENLDTPKERKGVTVYRQLCSSCHSSGQKDLVPQINDPAAWQTRLAQGNEALYKNTIDGIGDMPPKGLCDNCTEAEIRAAVDFMVKRLRNQG